MSSYRYYLTIEDLKFKSRVPINKVLQIDYLEGYVYRRGICRDRDLMYKLFISKLETYIGSNWQPEDMGWINEEVYSIVAELEDSFEGLFKEKKAHEGKGWYERKMEREKKYCLGGRSSWNVI